MKVKIEFEILLNYSNRRKHLGISIFHCLNHENTTLFICKGNFLSLNSEGVKLLLRVSLTKLKKEGWGIGNKNFLYFLVSKLL